MDICKKQTHFWEITLQSTYSIDSSPVNMYWKVYKSNELHKMNVWVNISDPWSIIISLTIEYSV